jgi:anti-sigma regulatory factor (Ser/Thr protein kinase)
MTAMSELSFAWRVDPEPAQVSHAREQVRKILPGWGLAEHDDLVQLIVSELVTNAMPHCRLAIEVRLSYDGATLSIQVSDEGDNVPIRQDPGDEDENGRGLQLIDGLIEPYAGTRGTFQHQASVGKTVYIIITLPARRGFQAGGMGSRVRQGLLSSRAPGWTDQRLLGLPRHAH